VLVVGTPGSGKTTFTLGLLDRMWKQFHIPFLVIEPAKTEYRALIRSIPDLQIFTPGKSHVSPLVLNPFVPPEGVVLETYRSTLKTAFAAGVTMATPLDRIFEDAIVNAYSENRWLDNYRMGDGGAVFSIHEFLSVFEKTFEQIGYTGEAKNIGRAGAVRLSGMSRLFDTYRTIPLGDLLSRPTSHRAGGDREQRREGPAHRSSAAEHSCVRQQQLRRRRGTAEPARARGGARPARRR
jgi:hypothetical protein